MTKMAFVPSKKNNAPPVPPRTYSAYAPCKERERGGRGRGRERGKGRGREGEGERERE